MQYLWGIRFVDDLVLRDRDTNGDGTLDERLYALCDPRFSIIAITDDSGAVQERYGYDGYGSTSIYSSSDVPRVSSNFAWEFRYTGRRQDLESLLYFFRYYHAELGRFLSRDPAGYVDGMSLYRGYFVPGDVDPTGRRKVCCGYQRGYVIKEKYGRTVDCPTSASAMACCNAKLKVHGALKTLVTAEGPCGGGGGSCALVPIVTTKTVVKTVPKKALCRTGVGVAVVLIVVAIEMKCKDEPYPYPEAPQPPHPPTDVDDDDDWDKCYEYCQEQYTYCLDTPLENKDHHTRCETCWNKCRSRCRLNPRPIPVWGPEMDGVNCKYWRNEQL